MCERKPEGCKTSEYFYFCPIGSCPIGNMPLDDAEYNGQEEFFKYLQSTEYTDNFKNNAEDNNKVNYAITEMDT